MMGPAEVGLIAQACFAATAVLAAIALPRGARNLGTGVATAAVGLAGVATGVLALNGHGGTIALPVALPVGHLALAPTPLGGFFMVIAGAVGALAAVYAIGYAHGPSSSRTAWVAFPTFLLAMQLVPAAADAVTFLLMWETMALASTALVLTEHAVHDEVRSAALWYTAMTHLSFVLILLGFAVLASASGDLTFAGMAAADVGPVRASTAFVLLALGFLTKAGAVPLHVWLPRAHPVAPSHVSAVMSAAMVKMGVYGTLLVTLRLLPGGPPWWALTLLAVGGVSAMYGILEASVTSDLKRLLAYSTTENAGLMFLALGASLLLRATGVAGPADAALLACLLLAASHAAFKTALFLGAGSILHATGERELDRMGGLGRRMPLTALAFGAGALGAAALPISLGFVAEWTLLQSLIHGADPDNRLVATAMPLSVAVVALTAGLGLLTFVKAYGIAFLARPRSSGADQGREATPTMWAATATAGVVVLACGLVPGPLTALAAQALGMARTTTSAAVDLPGITDGVLDPVAVTVLAAVLAVPVLLVTLWSAWRQPRRRVDLAWGCGGARLSPRMQYTATSYAEPLTRVFAEALRPERDVVVTHSSEARYLVEQVQAHLRLADSVEKRVYAPLLLIVDRIGMAARHLQNGSIHRYLAYSFFALVAVLVVVAL